MGLRSPGAVRAAGHWRRSERTDPVREHIELDVRYAADGPADRSARLLRCADAVHLERVGPARLVVSLRNPRLQPCAEGHGQVVSNADRVSEGGCPNVARAPFTEVVVTASIAPPATRGRDLRRVRLRRHRLARADGDVPGRPGAARRSAGDLAADPLARRPRDPTLHQLAGGRAEREFAPAAS